MQSWNDESGDWRGLASATQAPRYSEIARIIGRFCPQGSVLDVGCGEAVLRDYLPKYLTYLGIEPSAKAAETARAKYGSDSIVHSTAESFEACDLRWDCIVFNEMLYYSLNPLSLLEKYAKLVREEGTIIVSIYQKASKVPIKKGLMHWLDRHRPMSNVHCTKMVREFMARHNWLVDVDKSIARPGGTEYWRILAAEPRTSRRDCLSARAAVQMGSKLS
jgi:2-polyprenyl-3-methyl-5-hydroxy-6-metoxy-1,4-benzoquinol methylase